jgi:hypothetical protein
VKREDGAELAIRGQLGDLVTQNMYLIAELTDSTTSMSSRSNVEPLRLKYERLCHSLAMLPSKSIVQRLEESSDRMLRFDHSSKSILYIWKTLLFAF